MIISLSSAVMTRALDDEDGRGPWALSGVALTNTRLITRIERMTGRQQLPHRLTGADFKGLDAGRAFLADAIHRGSDESVPNAR